MINKNLITCHLLIFNKYFRKRTPWTFYFTLKVTDLSVICFYDRSWNLCISISCWLIDKKPIIQGNKTFQAKKQYAWKITKISTVIAKLFHLNTMIENVCSRQQWYKGCNYSKLSKIKVFWQLSPFTLFTISIGHIIRFYNQTPENRGFLCRWLLIPNAKL